MKKMIIAPFVVSIWGLVFFMNHFWQSYPACAVLWSLAAASGIYCLYAGIIHRSEVENVRHKAILLAVAIIGGIILLGVTLSAIFLFAPRIT